MPIYQTTSYVFNDSDHAANLFNLSEPGFIYTRINNPTNDILEQRLAALEGGIAAVTTASGTAAIATTFLTLLRAGDHVVASNSLYGGTYNLLNVTLPRLGIITTFVDPQDPDAFQQAVQENTRAVFVESLGNPKLDVLDLQAIAAVAKANNIPFIVDNTVATPALVNPFSTAPISSFIPSPNTSTETARPWAAPSLMRAPLIGPTASFLNSLNRPRGIMD